MSWSQKDFERINQRTLELENEKKRALIGQLDEERNCFLIYFDPGDSEIRGQKDVLMRAVKTIEQHPGCRVIVLGHTDQHGDHDANMYLASRRAIGVRVRLSLAGVPFEQMELISMGSTDPRKLSSPDSVDARNRRVEILIKE